MYKIIVNSFFIIFIAISYYSNAAEYKIQILPINLVDIECQLKSLNDNGVMLLTYKDSTYHSKICIYDEINGMNVIESKGESIHPISINNSGQVLANSYKTFIWNRELGIRYLNIFNSDYNNGIDINDLGQIIGTYRPSGSDYTAPRRPFLWNSGSVTDMGPGSEFCKQFEILGYHVMDVTLTSINNNGEIAGHFRYGKFNEKKKKYITLGTKVFFWDGDMHILPLTVQSNFFPQAVKMNNKSIVLVQVDLSTYLWNRDNGLTLIPDFIGISLNDSTVILGIQTKLDFDIYKTSIWRDGNIINLAELLGVDNLDKISPLYSETYEVEKLTDFIDINNKDQVGCNGLIWNEKYPCVLEPLVGKDS